MTLSEAIIGKSYCIDKIETNEKVGRRLEALGLIYNTKIVVLNRKRNGTLVFKARGTRLAVGTDISSNIYIMEEAQ